MESHSSHSSVAGTGPRVVHWSVISRGTLLTLVSVSGLVLILGAAFSPDRVLANLLLVAFYLISLGLFGIVFVAIQYASGAGWSVGFRRIPEAMSGVLWIGGLAILPVLASLRVLYEWSHSDVVAHDHLLQLKSGWLDPFMFIVRSVIYLFVWIGMAYFIIRRSRRQDVDGSSVHTERNVLLGALFLVVFGVTFSVASFDWLMSLEPHWFSTVFGVYNFSGMFTSGLATLILILLGLKRLGWLKREFTEEHLHDLGKLLFGFSCFWAYIWFCQYMLIWYANIPEETAYYEPRTQGIWGALMFLCLFLNWVVPFLGLLPRAAKRSAFAMARVSCVVLVGHWLDLYLMIMPSIREGGALPGLIEIAGATLLFGLFVWGFGRSLGRANLVPARDPYLPESLQHHV